MFDKYTLYLYAAYGITLGGLLIALILVIIAWKRASR
jgi:hypothetical protein